MLYSEVVEALDPSPGKCFIDATLGAGGHAEGILERSKPSGKLLGLDADPGALALAAERLHRYENRTVLVRANFGDLAEVALQRGFSGVDGIVFDLGLSSLLLEQSGRGFSFLRDEPLDMRLDPRQASTAADIVNAASEVELTRLLRAYGEEPHARAIARTIVTRRASKPIETSLELADLVARVVRGPERAHPATRTFQALRIATNAELDELQRALPQALELLRPGGRLAVVSFHSLEDRVVKQFFVTQARGCICPPKLPICVCGRRPTLRILTKKPVVPSRQEIAHNPRCRSAKLRVAEAIGRDTTSG